MTDTMEEIVSQLRAFIRAEATKVAPAMAHGHNDAFPKGVLVQPRSPPQSVDKMADTYRRCLSQFTGNEKLVLDRIISALADAA